MHQFAFNVLNAQKIIALPPVGTVGPLNLGDDKVDRKKLGRVKNVTFFGHFDADNSGAKLMQASFLYEGVQ